MEASIAHAYLAGVCIGLADLVLKRAAGEVVVESLVGYGGHVFVFIEESRMPCASR